ncbi:MAG: diguanylate cyclase [Motiliproteus sp.]
MTTDKDLAALQKRIQKLQVQQESDQSELDALGRVTVRLCLASKGLDQQLDTQLEPLQERLKRPDGGSLLTKASAAEKALMGFFQRRDQSVRQILEAMRAMLTPVWELTGNADDKRELDTLLNELPDTVENVGEYPQLLSKTARFITQVLPKGANDAAPVAIPDSETEEQLTLLCHRIGSMLLGLLGQLSIPQAERKAARYLMKRIEQGFEWQKLSSVLEELVELILKSMVVRQEDFEGYLESLNLQLSDIQGFLVESREHQHQHRQSSQELDQAVRSDVSKVETSLTQAQSLDHLKDAVRVQLADIVNAVDRYRSQQEVREQQVEVRLEQLQDKLETMDQQTVQLQAHIEEQRMRATSDPLTTLPNRAAYNDRVEQEFTRWNRYHKPLTMVVCDLDLFKRINDSYGHLAGDKVLRLIAKLIAGRLRDSDFVARYGGEEFVMLMPETGIEQAQKAVEGVREAISKSPFNFNGEPVQITMSFGLTEFRTEDASYEDVFQRADDALFKAKQQGRNRSVIAPG